MNDQYKHAEKHLTPSIAEELIKELYTEQTTRIQEIKDVVDKTHRERDGLPSRASGVSILNLRVCDLEEGEVTSPLRSYYLQNKGRQTTSGVSILNLRVCDLEEGEVTSPLRSYYP